MTYIYESPDHGETVYRRKIGDNSREIYKQNAEKQAMQDRWLMWRDILTASKTNLALKEALDRAQIIYELSRNDNF
jgi:outer membrane protein TolC